MKALKRGEASANRVLYNYKRNAKLKNLKWELSKEDFLRLTQEHCFYCNVPPSRTAAYHNSTGGYIYNGLDRIDNTKHYSLDNIVTCCSECNWAKKERNQVDFLRWVQTVWDHTLR